MKSRKFDVYAFADYSGSKPTNDQKKSIALSIIGNDNEKPQTTKCYTRESLRYEIQSLLVKTTLMISPENGQKLLMIVFVND